jgi:hypothetical protein
MGLKNDLYYNPLAKYGFQKYKNTGNWIFVDKKSKLPAAVGGDIILPPDLSLVICGTIDLNGDRLVTSGPTTILGGSSETSYLTSTGLDPAQALIKSDWTLAMQFMSLSDVTKAIDIDGTVNNVALDWTGVNFLNVPFIGKINTCDNFVYTKGAFLGSKEMVFEGTHGTIAFNNSLLSGDGLLGDIVRLDAGTVINRRFRIIYSSIVSFGSTNGINVDAGVLMPNEAFILDTVNFSGRTANATEYLPGLNHTDNRSLFDKCTGIINSGNISQYYMNGNATPTPIASTGIAYKAEGITTSAAVTQKFTNTNNRATYIGALSKHFSVTASLSVTSGNNHQIGIYIAKNGIVLPESEIYITTNGAGRAEGAVVQSLVLLENGDYIEVFVENETAVTNITITDLNVIII